MQSSGPLPNLPSGTSSSLRAKPLRRAVSNPPTAPRLVSWAVPLVVGPTSTPPSGMRRACVTSELFRQTATPRSLGPSVSGSTRRPNPLLARAWLARFSVFSRAGIRRRVPRHHDHYLKGHSRLVTPRTPLSLDQSGLAQTRSQMIDIRLPPKWVSVQHPLYELFWASRGITRPDLPNVGDEGGRTVTGLFLSTRMSEQRCHPGGVLRPHVPQSIASADRLAILT